jgi:hypothetical protein
MAATMQERLQDIESLVSIPEKHAGPPQVFLTPSGGLTRSGRSGGSPKAEH